MKTTQTTPFFHLLFLLYLLVTFISKFESTLNSFSNSLFWSVLACKIPQFLQKLLIWTVHQTFPESRDTLMLPKIYIMFCLPAGAKYPSFRIQLMDYIEGWRKFHTELVSFFITSLATTKIAFKSPFDLYFYLLIIEFFWFA